MGYWGAVAVLEVALTFEALDEILKCDHSNEPVN